MATIVFIHGAWMSPACWDRWASRYKAKGHECLQPAWPYDDRPVAELKQSPAPELAGLGVTEIVDHYDKIIRALPAPPILIGHSFGGLFVQMLLDRGLGSAGVAIDPGPPRGVLPSFSAIRAGAPVLFSWLGWKRVLTMSFADFQWSFAHTLPEAQQRADYDSYVVPTPGRIYFQAALGVGTKIDFKNPKRAPLLLIAGDLDRTVSPSMVRATYNRQKQSPSITAYQSFPNRTHWLIGAPGWEELADAAIAWSESPKVSTPG